MLSFVCKLNQTWEFRSESTFQRGSSEDPAPRWAVDGPPRASPRRQSPILIVYPGLFLAPIHLQDLSWKGCERKVLSIVLGSTEPRAQDSVHPSGRTVHAQSIYGIDDRIDTYQETDPQLRQYARAVCALIKAENLSTNETGRTLTLKTQPFVVQGYYPYESEPFRNQPLAAFGSGFLISSNLVVTAGHCIDSEHDLTQIAFVFGFQMRDASTAITNLTVDQVFYGAELIARELQGDRDWAVVRLSQPVALADFSPLPFRRIGDIAEGIRVGVIGHPMGLPQKIAFGINTTVRHNNNTNYFTANLDTYGGNSGSPVLNAETGEVEGILVRGWEPSFRLTNGNTFVSIVRNDADPGAEVTKSGALPWAALLGVEPPVNDAFDRAIQIPEAASTVRGWNIRATTEKNEPAYARNGGKSVWWTFAPTTNGVVSVNTSGSSFNTVLSVFRGDSMFTATPIAEAENGSSVGNSFVAFYAERNLVYHIAVGGAFRDAGEVVLNVFPNTGKGTLLAKATPIAIPPNRVGFIYPSAIQVTNLPGVIKHVAVTLNGLNQSVFPALDVLLVGPTGQGIVLAHRINGGAGPLTLTFDDLAAEAIPADGHGVTPPTESGRYRPGDYEGTLAAMPSPAPMPPYTDRLSVLNGADPNGVWALYVRDTYSGGMGGTLTGGWVLNVETVPNTAPTIGYIADQTFRSSDSIISIPFKVGDAETAAEFLAIQVLSSDSSLVDPVQTAVIGQGGQRELLVVPVAGVPGTVDISLRVLDGAGASATRKFTVTLLSSGRRMYMNSAAVWIPPNRVASIYPSAIQVTNLPGVIKHVAITLNGLNQSVFPALDVLLVGPTGQGIVLAHRINGGAGPLTLTFDDLAAEAIPADGHGVTPPTVSGRYRPGNYEGALGSMPSPAPMLPYVDRLSVLNSANPNGIWALYVRDTYSGGKGGTLTGGWVLDVETETDPSHPRVKLAVVGGLGKVEVSWFGEVARGYRLESTDSLLHPVWKPVSSFNGVGSVLNWNESTGSSPSKFFQLIELK